jgi:hypothetical protein
MDEIGGPNFAKFVRDGKSLQYAHAYSKNEDLTKKLIENGIAMYVHWDNSEKQSYIPLCRHKKNRILRLLLFVALKT